MDARIDLLFRAINAHRHPDMVFTGLGLDIRPGTARLRVSSPFNPNVYLEINQYGSISAKCIHSQCETVSSVLPYCDLHAVEVLNVRVKETVYGDGLFAFRRGATDNEIVFQTGAYIAPYLGVMMTTAECNDLYNHEDYVCPYAILVDTIFEDNSRQIQHDLEDVDCYVIDSILCMSYGAKANTSIEKNDINAYIITSREREHSYLVARRPIRQGDQIVCAYISDDNSSRRDFGARTEDWLNEQYLYEFLDNTVTMLPDIRNFFGLVQDTGALYISDDEEVPGSSARYPITLA